MSHSPLLTNLKTQGKTPIHAEPAHCELFEPRWQQHLRAATPKQRDRKPRLCLSEVLTIIVGFHLSGYRTFKGYYTQHVLPHPLHYFPKLVSYQRFVELMPGALLPLCVLLRARFGQCSGISFIDSTKKSRCHNRRIWSHKVFKALSGTWQDQRGLVLWLQAPPGGQ
jgi:hypothetical protein